MDGIVTLDDAQRDELQQAAERMFSITASEILGQRLDRILPDGMAKRHVRLVDEFGRSGVTRRQLGGAGVYGRRATGETFPIDLSISQAIVDGRKVYAGILRGQARTGGARCARPRAAAALHRLRSGAMSMFDRDMRYLAASGDGSPTIASRGPTSSDAAITRSFRIPQSWRDIHRRCLEGAVEACEEDCFVHADQDRRLESRGRCGRGSTRTSASAAS
ncbi:MAG: PAS domain-containing protein [Burkholderiaceae bacterium]